MKTYRLGFIFCLMFFIGSVSCYAQQLTASTNKARVAVGEHFQISYTLNGSGSNFKQPSLNDFDVYSGPNQSQSVQLINGNMSQSITFSYVIAAKKEGKFTIGPASIHSNGQKIDSKPLVIEVKGTLPQQQQRHGQSRAQQGTSTDLGDNLFLKCVVNKTKAYVGEQIIATFKIYTRVNIVDNSLSRTPELNGFWTEDIPSRNNQAEQYTENFEGVQYTVAELKKTILFPQKAGTLEIDPMQLDCIVRQRTSHGNSIFDHFFGGGVQDSRVSISTKPIKIEVIPLPLQGKPEGFSGAVGTFSIESKINKNQVKTNEAVNFTVSISGKGNIKMIDPVKPEFSPDIETYDPKISDNIQASTSGLSGKRTYDFLLIPRHAGDFNLPSIPFSYFDPQKKEYVILNTPDFPLHVEKGKDSESGQGIINHANQEDIKSIGTDIRFIKTSSATLTKDQSRFFGSGLHFSLMVTPLLLLAAVALGKKKYEKETADVPYNRTRKATKVALSRLADAHSHLKNNNDNAFYQEVYKSLTGYLGDKLHLQQSSLSKEIISSTLHSRNVNETTVLKFIDIMDKCEFARYAPLQNKEGMELVYEQAKQVIINVEEDLK